MLSLCLFNNFLIFSPLSFDDYSFVFFSSSMLFLSIYLLFDFPFILYISFLLFLLSVWSFYMPLQSIHLSSLVSFGTLHPLYYFFPFKRFDFSLLKITNLETLSELVLQLLQLFCQVLNVFMVLGVLVYNVAGM